MKTIEFKSLGHGPVTEVLVDGVPWNDVCRASLTILPTTAPALSLFITGDDSRVVVEGVTVTVISKPWPPAGVRSAALHATLKEPSSFPPKPAEPQNITVKSGPRARHLKGRTRRASSARHAERIRASRRRRMRFPAVVFLSVCGAFLVMGGVLIGSEVTTIAGYAFWIGALLVVLHSTWRFVADAWHDYKLRKALSNRTFRRDYRPGAGLR